MIVMLPYHDTFLVAGYDAVDRALLKASFVIAALGFYLRNQHTKQNVPARGLESFFFLAS